jgi:hypothetical protein
MSSSGSDSEGSSISFGFSFIGLPHAYDAAYLAARRPTDYDHSSPQKPERQEPWLTIVCSVVFKRKRWSGKDNSSFGHVKLAPLQRVEALRFIKLDLHLMLLH